MLTKLAAIGSNRLLNLLTDHSRQNFVAHCELVSINLGEVISNTGDDILYVYFPVEGIISLEKQTTGSPSLVVTLIGNEGMLCTNLLLGISVTACRAVVQKSGFAFRISSVAFIEQIKQNSGLELVLKHYAYVTYNQVLQIAACNLFHLLENRLARLLLMFQDRAQCDELQLTQEQLAKMLGVRRVGVTKAAGSLQNKKLISYIRGSVIIHDRKGLKASACICYEENIENDRSIMLM